MSVPQVVYLFNVLRQQRPWSAVLFLLALVLGERVDAARKCRMSWLRGLEEEGGALPTISIPQCNGKTKAREDIPLQADFTKLLHGWIWKHPLQGENGQQWPHPELTLHNTDKRKPDKLLFPGRQLGGANKRDESKPISPKALWNCFKSAQRYVAQERKDCHAKGEKHVFDDIDLGRITSHSCKKTAVTLLSEHTSTAIMAAITATSPRVLDTTYVCPTKRKQREAVDHAFSPIVIELAAEGPREDTKPAAGVFCVSCGSKRQSAAWLHCPICGNKYVA